MELPVERDAMKDIRELKVFGVGKLLNYVCEYFFTVSVLCFFLFGKFILPLFAYGTLVYNISGGSTADVRNSLSS